MSGDATRDHYDRLAATYDENWAYSPQFLQWMNGCIQARLRIADGDVAADIGCGTGLYARGLAEHAAELVCADASAHMLAQVTPRSNMILVQATAEDLASGNAHLPHDGYDAILLKEVLHHVGDPATVIAGLARLLNPGGRMLVVMLPARIGYPLFAAALELFAERQPDPAGIAAAMRATGLQAELSFESFPLAFPAQRYLQMVRNRYMSLLSSFDDAAIDAGIAEIRRAHPGGQIRFTDTFAFVLGLKA